MARAGQRRRLSSEDERCGALIRSRHFNSLRPEIPSTLVPQENLAPLGITVNGLAILKNQPDVGAFYRESVRTPDGFVVEARDFSDFESAMLNKLMREVAGGPPPAGPALR